MIASSPHLKQRPFFLFEERVSCFPSSIVLYQRWQALELASQLIGTCRKSFSRVRRLKLADKREQNNRHPASRLVREEPTKPCVSLAEPLEIEPLPGRQKQHSQTSVLLKETLWTVDQSLSSGVP